jgi:hypothetical protein
MSRPDFPKPYTPLTPGMISRIIEDQNYYDKDPERYERIDRERAENRRQEEEYQQREYQEQQRNQEENQ